MRQIYLLLLACSSYFFLPAQVIDFDYYNPAPTFQDADVGAMEFADIDGDGDADLLITGKGGPILSTLYRNDGSGNFTGIQDSTILDVFGGSVGFADVDLDGDLDLMVTGNDGRPVFSAELYLNDGTGNFTLVANTPFEGAWGGDFEFGDVNNDTLPDLIQTGENNQGMAFTKLYGNTGSGSFVEVTGIGLEAVKYSAVEFIDMENDGDLDIIYCGENNSGTKVTRLYRNFGSGNFLLVPGTPFTPVDLGDIAVADSDGDGDQDVLISGSTQSNSTITELYLNDGMGNFTLATNTPFASSSAGETRFADFDNDGDPDVVIVGVGTAIISNIYENLGNNTYVLADTLPGAYTSCTAIGDIDGDNDLDLVIGGTSFTQPIRGTKTYENLTPIALNLEESFNHNPIGIYPNPSHGEFSIQAEEFSEGVVMVFNAGGRKVLTQNLSGSETTIRLSQPAGIYWVVIQISDRMFTKKIVVK